MSKCSKRCVTNHHHHSTEWARQENSIVRKFTQKLCWQGDQSKGLRVCEVTAMRALAPRSLIATPNGCLGFPINGTDRSALPASDGKRFVPTNPKLKLLACHVYMITQAPIPHFFILTTLKIPISEGGKLVKVILKFSLCYELAPPKDSGSIVHPGSWHYSLKVSALGKKVSTLGIVRPSS